MINYDTPDNLIPIELRKQIEEANKPHVHAVHKRLNTPVPGNPQGGFPGFGVIEEHKQTVKALRNQLIDKWNAENPDHELVVSPPLEPPITPEEIKQALQDAVAKPKAAAKLSKAHVAHIEEVLKEHPKEHHEALRAFAKHELDSSGLKPQQYYFLRATTLEKIKAKGLDPHNLAHRYQHHCDVNAELVE